MVEVSITLVWQVDQERSSPFWFHDMDDSANPGGESIFDLTQSQYRISGTFRHITAFLTTR